MIEKTKEDLFSMLETEILPHIYQLMVHNKLNHLNIISHEDRQYSNLTFFTYKISDNYKIPSDNFNIINFNIIDTCKLLMEEEEFVRDNTFLIKHKINNDRFVGLEQMKYVTLLINNIYDNIKFMKNFEKNLNTKLSDIVDLNNTLKRKMLLEKYRNTD